MYSTTGHIQISEEKFSKKPAVRHTADFNHQFSGWYILYFGKYCNFITPHISGRDLYKE
jgi:hypothetical protein